MATIVSDDIKARVQQATDLVRLIGEHVALRPRGREFIGLCPFHDDKNPSMYVSPAKQIYKCFSCGAGGDAFSFLMGYHKMTFPEALKHLAERAGIVLPEKQDRHSSDEAAGSTLDRTTLLDANAKACSFFQTVFRHSEHGKVPRDYVAHRHINPDMIEAFQIGYAPDRWDGLTLTIHDKKWTLAGFEKLGLISRRTTGDGYYDRFRHRLTFPICDSLGRVIAFGGRKLREEDEPKYLNSPESMLFNKSATLYGLHLAKKSIIHQRTAVVVEGYTDVIACHQHGVKNVVATLGTALTAQHVVELRRYCDRVILIYDGDEAGVKAADRALEIFLTGGLDVAIAIIPDELDPGDLFELPDGLERWNKVIASATDALAFGFQRTHAQWQGIETVTGRQKLIEDYLRRLAQMGLGGKKGLGAYARGSGASGNNATVRRAMILQQLASLLRLSESEIDQLLTQFTPVTRQSPLASSTPLASSAESALSSHKTVQNTEESAEPFAIGQSEASIKALRVAERQIIGCLLLQPELFHQVYLEGRPMDEALTPMELPTAWGKLLYERMYQTLAEGQSLTLNGLLADLAESGQPDLATLATDALSEVEKAWGDKPEGLRELLTGSVRAILTCQRQQEYQACRLSLMNRGNEPVTDEQATTIHTELSDPQSATTPPLPGAGIVPGTTATTPVLTESDALRRIQEHLNTPSMRRMPRVRR